MKFNLDGTLQSVDADTTIGRNGRTTKNEVTTLSVVSTPPAPTRPPPLKRPVRFMDTVAGKELLQREVLSAAQAMQILELSSEEFAQFRVDFSVPVIIGYDAEQIRNIAEQINAERDKRGENVPE